MKTLRIATWNMRAAFPKLKGPTKTEEMWKWAHKNLAADIYVFTEAKIPESGIPNGWNAVWVEGGIGGRRPAFAKHLKSLSFAVFGQSVSRHRR